ncbi:LysR family transcriptional regulator [Xanthobacter versatilis]|uniref:LysR family transcriptional regulator n=1 Tax=Xanthobacter autotrophicus (strain ATCC BAA-1158 / Py2) TaxID=78245 RepID=UPI00372C47E5
MVDFRSLEIFYWVSQLESFSKAAERLNTTQPAVSQRIAALETELRTRLFERSSRSISLTEKGRVLVDYAERFLRLRSAMLEAVATPEAMRGVVRLGVAETIVQTWLSRFIERAHAVYPNVLIDITVDVSPVMRDALVKRELDLAFLLGPVNEPNMSNLDLGSYALAFIAASDLSLAAEPLSRRDLLKYPLITYPKSTYPYTFLREVLSIPDIGSPRLFSNSSLSTIIRMTEDHIGLSVIPPDVIRAELAAGKLRVVETEVALPDLAFTASYPMAMGGGIAGPLAALAAEVAREDRAGELANKRA